MSETSPAFHKEFRIETWTLYSVGMLLTVTRIGFQIHRVGITKLRSDDWLIMVAVLWYTLLCVSLNIVVKKGGSNFISDAEASKLVPEEIKARENGSKWVMVSEQAMICSVWTCKVCMLLIYKRLTQGITRKAVIINAVMIYALVGFIGCQIAYFAECRPFHEYWSVPTQQHDCWSYYSFEIVVAIFNISSDLIVLCVAIPLLVKLHIPTQQKVAITTVFGMGIFVVVAAILTKVFSLSPSLVSYSYLNWYFREASVSLYVVNLPSFWALVRECFPSVGSWGYRSRGSKPDETGTPMPTLGSQRTRPDDCQELKDDIDQRRWGDCEDGCSNTSPFASYEAIAHGSKL